ncbi:nondiscriminating glutamyl-tRNA synthetase EARS2, mitochondrial-like [Babylonia areolata]|uniref:nondiscriminating glutamyl-tRNA synthetase EARS2, mitochondrial-like n=1 Tax=Babylonia areolata TaxID=304850 RepID=UPI003FD4D6A8
MAAPLRLCTVCFRYLDKSVGRLHTSARLASSDGVRVRFAPSPTGFLHLGGLRTALYNYLFAKAKGGTFILRIEDTDQSRVVPGAVEKLESMLQWTGLIPDEGPSQGGSRGPYKQSERLELYQESIKTLIQNGSAYHCFCSPTRLDLLRRDAIQRGETPRYDNRCRHLDPGEVKDKLAGKVPYVVRLKLQPTTEPWEDMIKGPVSHNVAEIEGDPVLMKTDGFPTYHLANVVDDHYMGVSHVLRGDEWQPSTPKHVLLYRAFGWPAPRFAHLPLIVNKDGTKLSKRQGDIHIEHFKERGYSSEAVLSYVTTIGGGFDCDTSDLTLDQLVHQFQIERVKRHHGRLDPLFLETSSQSHLRRLLVAGGQGQGEGQGEGGETAGVVVVVVEELQALLRDHYSHRSREVQRQVEALGGDYLLHVLRWAVGEDRITKLTDLLQPTFTFLWEMPGEAQVRELCGQNSDLEHLVRGCLRGLQEVEGEGEGGGGFTKEGVGRVLKSQAGASGRKVKEFMPLMRQVLSGLKEGPPVAEMMAVMGRDNSLRRLEHCIKLIHSLP